MGPFFGQILQNISCNFDDSISTTTANSTGVASNESKLSTNKKEAFSIFQAKLASLENKQRQELHRFEQEIGGSQDEAEDHRGHHGHPYYTTVQDQQAIPPATIGYVSGNNPEIP